MPSQTISDVPPPALVKVIVASKSPDPVMPVNCPVPPLMLQGASVTVYEFGFEISGTNWPENVPNSDSPALFQKLKTPLASVQGVVVYTTVSVAINEEKLNGVAVTVVCCIITCAVGGVGIKTNPPLVVASKSISAAATLNAATAPITRTPLPIMFIVMFPFAPPTTLHQPRS